MSTDPYHAVQREVQTSLQSASTLRASYMRIRSTARDDSEELIWARNEVERSIFGIQLVNNLSTVKSNSGCHGG
jgi:hypothetical protein